MNKPLKDAIEAMLADGKNITMKRVALREAYQGYQENMTETTKPETAKRKEFLRDCLETGVSKREAARMLVKHDPRVGQKTAETLVYLNFSGEYQTTKRGRRRTEPVEPVAVIATIPPPALDDDESIL